MKVVMVLAVFCSFLTQAEGLRNAYQSQFLIGTAISSKDLATPNNYVTDKVCKEFNAVTAENAMKWQNIQPQPGVFDFTLADQLMALAKTCHAEVFGHTLVWHQQTPAWVFKDAAGKPLSRDALLARMQLHIKTVMGRYKEQITGWDVVNEALDEQGQLRQSPWREIIGDDYVVKAFEFAHHADPNAKLYYNDFNLFKADKVRGAVRIVKAVQQAGIPVAGVGMQGHYLLQNPTLEQVETAINIVRESGVKVSITELDISVLPLPEAAKAGAEITQNFKLEAANNPYPNGLPTAKEAELTQAYRDFFTLYLKHSDLIERVTVWGIDDGATWRNNWPVRGRTDYPLLFNRQGQPKPAYHAVMALPQ